MPTTLSIKPKTASFLAAGSLGVLVALAMWGFELRSLSRLLMHSAAIVAGVWPFLYFLFYRKQNLDLRVDRIGLISALTTALLFGFLITPTQVSNSRYTLALIVDIVLFMVFYLACLLPMMRMTFIHWERMLYIIACLCGTGGLSILLLNTFSSRIYADDFCYALQLAEMGFWRSSLWFYMNWSGRFFSNFLVMGFSPYHQAQFFFLVAIVITSSLCLSAVLAGSGLTKKLAALAGALLLTLTVMTVTPDVYKSLYWNGSAMVVLPLLVLIPIYLYLLASVHLGQSEENWLVRLIVFLLGIAITTTHEVAAVGWVTMHVMALVWLMLCKSKNARFQKILLIGLIAALVGLAVLYFSPGAANRAAEQQFPGGRSIPYLIQKTLEDFFYFLTHISVPYYPYQLDGRPGWLLIAAAAGIGWLLDVPFNRRMAAAMLILLVTLAVVAVSFFPGGYIYSGRIPERTQLIPSTFLVLGVFVAAMHLPRANNQLFKRATILFIGMLMLFGSAASLSELWRTVEPMQQYAADWDARDAAVRLNGATPQRISIPWDEFEQEMGCIREYYQSLN